MQEFELVKSPQNITLKACSASFPQSTEYLIADLHPEILGCLEVQGLQKPVIQCL